MEFPMEVVLLFQDEACGARALDFYEHLLAQFGRDCVFHCHFWSFQNILTGQESEAGLRIAQGASMVVVAARAENPLPVAVKSWLGEVFSHSKVEDLALASIMVAERETAWEESPAQAFLSALSMGAGAPHFSQHFVTPRKPDWLTHAEDRRAQELHPSIWEEDRPTAGTSGFGWGINE